MDATKGMAALVPRKAAGEYKKSPSHGVNAMGILNTSLQHLDPPRNIKEGAARFNVLALRNLSARVTGMSIQVGVSYELSCVKARKVSMENGFGLTGHGVLITASP